MAINQLGKADTARWLVALWFVGATLVAAMCPLLTSAQIASACVTGRPNQTGSWSAGVDGMGYSGYVLGGIYGRVEQVPVTIPTTNYPGVVAWVMLLSSDAQSWAQIGWASSIQNGRETFSQVKESGYFHTYFNSPPVDSQYPYFTVFYNNTPGKFTFQVDNNWWTPRGSGGYQPPANFVPYEGNAGR